jgi:hypothetical protein
VALAIAVAISRASCGGDEDDDVSSSLSTRNGMLGRDGLCWAEAAGLLGGLPRGLRQQVSPGEVFLLFLFYSFPVLYFYF